MVLPLLLGLLGSGAASAGLLGSIGPLLAGSIGAGLGGYAETGDLEKGIMTGLGSFAGGALLGPMLGGAGAGGAAAQGANTATSAAALNAGTGGTVTSLAPQIAAKAAQAGINPATLGTMSQRGIDAALASNAAAAAAPAKGIMGMLGNGAVGDTARGGLAYMKTPTGMGAGIGAAMGGAMPSMGLFGSGDKKAKDEDHKEMQPIPRTMATPPTGYRAGYDPEWDYGISTPQSATDIRRYNQTRFAAGGLVDGMGPIHLAAGGIADLAPPPDTQAAPAENEKTVVVEAIKAVKGQSDNPQIALGKFLAMYGEDALRDLVQKVEDGEIGGPAAEDGEGMVRGAGDGMDDRVPARIHDTGEDVLLADSEYVVPADVVSHLGNGSSDAGAKQLDAMLERIRQARTGTADQAPQINPKEVLPA